MASSKTVGTLYGLLGMLTFSLTLPATRAAVLGMHPAVVAFGRPVAAGICAAALLLATRTPVPPRRYWSNFALMVVGVVIGVPLTFAWGMHALPSAHGAITLAILPLATALAGAVRAGERPSKRFWAATAVGSITVLAWARHSGAGNIQWGDVLLLLNVAASATGYTEGARLAKVMPGWQVMSWALVFGAPLHVIPLIFSLKAYGMHAGASAWIGFVYIAVVSQWSGMFAWLKGLALGGIARVGQFQLLQPFCTLLFAWVLLGESVTAAMVITAGIVVAAVAVGRNAVVHVPEDKIHRVSDSVEL